MPIITDKEFGEITVRRSARARQVRIRVAPDGRLRASLPLYAPLFLVRRLLKDSRKEIREILSQADPAAPYENGMQIGKSHTLIVRERAIETPKATSHGQQIIIDIPEGESIGDYKQLVRDAVVKALRKEAKSYLPRRLKFIAEKHGFEYQKVRFSHASSRWGSCSAAGTVSLNIALMKLPFELIDYVLIHELAHTQEMNHSDNFWKIVSDIDPEYEKHRKALKNYSTSI